MYHILILIQCPDKVGLVALVSSIVARHQLNIVVMREFVDHDSAQFFTRIECSGGNTDSEALKKAFTDQLGPEASVRVGPYPSDKKIAVLVTKEYHCLGDILVKYSFGVLGAEVCCVVGNYDVLGPFTRRFSIPFYHVSHENKSKQAFEQELSVILDRHRLDYIFLAKFMRILSPEFLAQFPDRVINIHHSFLPAFAGAHPYRRAFERGVKLIGATAHFVTPELDAGPIISQQTIKIDHTYTVAQMVEAGQEVEKTVLNRALKLVARDQVFISGNKTIIFE